MKYKVILEKSEEGFAVSVPGLPGCHSQGATEREALQNIAEAISEYLDVVVDEREFPQITVGTCLTKASRKIPVSDLHN